MKEDRVDRILRDLASDYNRPPETPRDRIWARIEEARERSRAGSRWVAPGPAWVRWGMGLAAAVLAGVVIGRVSMTHGPTGGATASGPAVGPTSEVVSTEAGRRATYLMATTEHLARAEALLTTFRADAERGGVDAEFWAATGDLLSNTRLLMDSPAARDPRMRSLLEDLELILVQMVRLAQDPGETDLVGEGLEQREILLRLRSAIPAGPAVDRRGVS